MGEYIACVRFLDEINKNYFIPTAHIKYDFDDENPICPENITDFEGQHEYDILWCGCNSEKCSDTEQISCSYFKGYIVCLGESKEDAEENSKVTRFRYPKKIFSPSEPTSYQSSQCENPKKVASALSQTDNLQVRIENLKGKAIEEAKKKAALEQLSKKSMNSFLNARPSVRICEVRQDFDDDGSENGHLQPTLRKGSMNNDNLSLMVHETHGRNNANTRQQNDISANGHQQQPLLDLRNEDLINNDNRSLVGQETPRRNNEKRRQQNPIMHIRQVRQFVQRDVRAPVVNEEEQQIDLYVTPEAQDVDPTGREKYQVIGDMIYLGEGKCVNKQFWDFLKVRGDGVFLREAAEVVCGKYKLVNRCLKLSRTNIRLRGRSPRKVITPKKYHLIRELFSDYINEKKYDVKVRDKLVAGINRQLGYKIKDLRKQLNYEEDEEE